MSLMSDIATAIKNKLLLKVDKVTSTDNAIVRFDGTTGAVQNSGVTIDDSNNVGIGVTPSAWDRGGILESKYAGNYFWGNGTNELYVGSNNYYNAGFKYSSSGTATHYSQYNGGHYFKTAPSGTAGNPITWTTAMTLDANGNLGIGTSSPQAKLHIKNTNNSEIILDTTTTGTTNKLISVMNNGSSYSDMELNCLNLKVMYGANERMRIDSNGNVGIGATPSSWVSSWKALELGGAGNSIYTAGQGSMRYGCNVTRDGGGYKYATANAAVEYRQANDGTHSWYNASVGTAGGTITWTNAMTLDASGNVGIGVTPSAWTNTGKTIQFSYAAISSDNATDSIELSSNAYYNTGWKYIQGYTAGRYAIANGQHTWYTAPSGTAGNAITWTNAMSLSQTGHMILGNTSLSTAVLNVVDQDASGGNSWAMAFQMKQSSTNGYPMLFLNSSGTTVGSIQTTATGTSYGVSSDYRLKEDWKPMENSIHRLMELKPCNFKWKEIGTRVDGFLAHEVQEVVPEAATGVKDEMMEEKYEISPRVEATYDEEGNELTPVIEAVIGKREVPKYQTIDQSKLVPLLTSALQEQQQIINDLISRVKVLESK